MKMMIPRLTFAKILPRSFKNAWSLASCSFALRASCSAVVRTLTRPCYCGGQGRERERGRGGGEGRTTKSSWLILCTPVEENERTREGMLSGLDVYKINAWNRGLEWPTSAATLSRQLA